MSLTSVGETSQCNAPVSLAKSLNEPAACEISRCASPRIEGWKSGVNEKLKVPFSFADNNPYIAGAGGLFSSRIIALNCNLPLSPFFTPVSVRSILVNSTRSRVPALWLWIFNTVAFESVSLRRSIFGGLEGLPEGWDFCSAGWFPDFKRGSRLLWPYSFRTI